MSVEPAHDITAPGKRQPGGLADLLYSTGGGGGQGGIPSGLCQLEILHQANSECHLSTHLHPVVSTV
jgi:hypothetical protein